MSVARSINLALHIYENPEAIAERAALELLTRCEEAIAQRGVFRLALAGGNTPLPLFKLLSKPEWIERLPWEKIVLYWGDERCVGPDHPQSNYGVARRELLSNVPVTSFYRMKGEDDPVQAAQAYEALLREHFNLAPGEVPVFDLILLGLGEDGHTASLFPGEPGMAEKERLVIDQFVRSRDTDRLTLTLPVLNNARCCMFTVTGQDKHAVLGKALDLLAPPSLPAQFVRPTHGSLIWIVDEAAARGPVA